MSAVDQLYDDVIMDHIKNVRNYGPLEAQTQTTEGVNMLCGDSLHVHLRVDGGLVAAIRFECSCCGISMASASLMTESVQGRSLEEAGHLAEEALGQLRGQAAAPEDAAALGRTALLATIRRFPSRVNCASLPWVTLAAAARGEANASL